MKLIEIDPHKVEPGDLVLVNNPKSKWYGMFFHVDAYNHFDGGKVTLIREMLTKEGLFALELKFKKGEMAIVVDQC